MPISLIVGPPNSGRAPELRRRLETMIERDPVLVVPTGDDAASFERELCRERAVLGVSIRTFASLFEEAAGAAGERPPPSLSEPQRLALLGAAVASTPLRLLKRSAARAGFVPALDSLIAELQAALVSPGDLDTAAREVADGAYERELAALYRAYTELRDRAGRSDPGSRAANILAALRAGGSRWGGRPVLVYGFDDLSAAQAELLSALAAEAEVVVAANYGDREALKVLARPLARLRDELGGEIEAELAHDPGYTDRESIRHLDRWLFEPGAPQVVDDGAVRMLECASELGEEEAVAGEIAALLATGVRPDDIVVVARDASARGPAIGRVLARFDIPAAVEAAVPLDRTAVGRALVALCRAAGPQGEPADLLAHLRSDPAMDAGAADWLERRIRRGRPEGVEATVAGWASPPRHLASVRACPPGPARLRALARIAPELAEAPHRAAAPVADGEGGVPFEPLELRAGAVAAALLEELAEVGAMPGCEPPDLPGAVAAIEAARVPLWRGPADGRVRVLDPHRVRAARASHLFCVGLQEGEFPRRAAQHPLLSEERRAGLGLPALVRRDPQDWERYLFHACVSRPTAGLYLSWRSADDEGSAVARSPFLDEVCDLIGPDPEGRQPIERRGLEQVTFPPSRAPSERELARALALRAGGADRGAALDQLRQLDLPAEVADRVGSMLAGIPDPDQRPGPLRAPAVLEELGKREHLSASSLEGWVECSYRWFVNHELRPQRLDPEPDPLRLGTVAHRALQRLYAEPPGADRIPRRSDLGRWKRRLGELLDAVAEEEGMRPLEPPDSIALARLRIQVNRFLEEESELETDLRPRPELLEARFGFGEDSSPALDLGGVSLRGAIDRIDVAPDGRTALVRDYKTSTKVPGRRKWEEKGKLQLQLYVLAARESLGLEPVGGVYHPLRGRGGDRRPRGILLADSPSLEGLDLVRGDPCDADELEAELGRARAQATATAAAMRSGAIARDPLGGSCPRWCTYQAICRLERAVGLDDEANGRETA